MSFKARRLSGRVLALLFLVPLVNYYANWHLFGGFDMAVMISFIPLGMLHYFLVGPSIEEFEEHRRLKDLQSGKQRRSPLEGSPVTWNVVRVLLAIPVLLTLVNLFSSRLGWFGNYTLEAFGISLFLSALVHAYLKPREFEQKVEKIDP